MLKMAGRGPDGPVFFLGLSRGNIDRLTHDQPIQVNLADMGGPDIKIVIVFEETEQILFDKIKAAGMIDTKTIIHPLPEDEP